MNDSFDSFNPFIEFLANLFLQIVLKQAVFESPNWIRSALDFYWKSYSSLSKYWISCFLFSLRYCWQIASWKSSFYLDSNSLISALIEEDWDEKVALLKEERSSFTLFSFWTKTNKGEPLTGDFHALEISERKLSWFVHELKNPTGFSLEMGEGWRWHKIGAWSLIPLSRLKERIWKCRSPFVVHKMSVKSPHYMFGPFLFVAPSEIAPKSFNIYYFTVNEAFFEGVK